MLLAIKNNAGATVIHCLGSQVAAALQDDIGGQAELAMQLNGGVAPADHHWQPIVPAGNEPFFMDWSLREIIRQPDTADLNRYAADARWRKETEGITVSGLRIFTDDRSKMMVMGARIKAENDPNFSTQWKGADGEFVQVDAATIIAISDAVLAHVDSCFAVEATVLAGIEAGTITSAAEIDAVFDN